MGDFGLWQGLLQALTLSNLAYASVGCLLGMLVGILPGLGPAAAMSLLLPVVVYMPPQGSIIIMAAIYYGAMYGGSTTAILMNIPGEVSSVVTAIDGYAMTRKGLAGEALAISAIGSYIAGIAGTVAIAWSGPRLAELAIRFGPPEYFGLVLFSLMALVSFSGRSLLLGLAIGALGIWLATFGTDPLTGTARLTFDNIAFSRGFGIIPVTVGLFGIGEVLFNAKLQVKQTYEGKLPNWLGMLPRGDRLRRGLAASLRGTISGGVLGLLPGMVPALTTYLAYNIEQKVAKHRAELGSGAIEGVAAPEAANNATAMTGFIPLFSLGIPTSPALAIVLGTLILNGLQPGPALFAQHADFAFTVIASMLVANTLLLVLALPLVGVWARISLIPYRILGPIIMAVCVVGAYSASNSLFGVGVAILFGVVGYVMRRLDWPMSPLILGFLMGPLLEQSMRQSLSMSGGDISIFFTRPVSLVAMVTTVVLVGAMAYLKLRSKMVSRLVAEGANEV